MQIHEIVKLWRCERLRHQLATFLGSDLGQTYANGWSHVDSSQNMDSIDYLLRIQICFTSVLEVNMYCTVCQYYYCISTISQFG